MRTACTLRSTPDGRLFAFAAILSLIGGCSEDSDHGELVPVTGTILYQGDPVAGAIVAFRGDGQSKPATGVTDASGRFQLTSYDEGDGVAPGTHIVTVTKYNSAAPDTSDTSMEAAETATVSAAPAESAIPEHYADPERSGLEQTVQAGQTNDFTIELTD